MWRLAASGWGSMSFNQAAEQRRVAQHMGGFLEGTMSIQGCTSLHRKAKRRLVLTVTFAHCSMEAESGSRMAYKTLGPMHMIKGMAHMQAWSSHDDMSKRSGLRRI